MSLREKILANKGFKTKIVNIPEWGGEVPLKTASVKDTISILKEGNNMDKGCLQIIACVVDEKGEQVFTAEDKEELLGMDTLLFGRVLDHINELHGIGSVEDKGKK